jgi:hypothetical protein
MKESATSSKASNPSQNFSFIVPDLWPNSFADLVTTFRQSCRRGASMTLERNTERGYFRRGRLKEAAGAVDMELRDLSEEGTGDKRC